MKNQQKESDQMIRFQCDYSEGAHPKVLEKLIETNFEQTAAYGNDPYCTEAVKLIREKCGRNDIDVHFLMGGTQTNLTFISAVLRPFQGVIPADTGHINIHETGAIESTGHKVLSLPSPDGKTDSLADTAVYDAHFNDEGPEHMVQPKLDYLSKTRRSSAPFTRRRS
jgi:threonine aldolase